MEQIANLTLGNFRTDAAIHTKSKMMMEIGKVCVLHSNVEVKLNKELR